MCLGGTSGRRRTTATKWRTHDRSEEDHRFLLWQSNHLLTENADEMAKVAQVLLEKEVIEGKELTLLLGMEEKEEKNDSPAEKEKPERESPGVLSEDSRTPNVLGEAPAD